MTDDNERDDQKSGPFTGYDSQKNNPKIYESDNTKYQSADTNAHRPVRDGSMRPQKTVTKNMPDRDYKATCKQIFDEVDAGNYGELDLN